MNHFFHWSNTILLVLALAGGPCADVITAAEPEAPHGNPRAGRRILLEKACLRCHSILSKGGVSAPDLAKLGGSYTYFQLVGMMWGHSPKMLETARTMGMAWPKLKPEEMEDITAYLHSVGETQEVGNVAAGQRLFNQVCVKCHQVGSRGGSIGPRLDYLGSCPSGVQMATAMWNHGSSMTGTMEKIGVDRPVLGDQDVAHLLSYMRAYSTDSSPVKYTAMGDPSAGQRVFEKSGCSTCHGPGGRGGDLGPDLVAAGPRGVARIAAKLWNHAPAMAKSMQTARMVMPVLDANETGDLMAFLGFLGYMDGKADTVAGRALYESKGCIECHGHPGKSDGTAPDLGDVAAMKTRSGVAAAMWNHAPGMAEALAKSRQQLTWPRFVGDEMRDLVGYLSDLASRKAGPEPGPGASAAVPPAPPDTPATAAPEPPQPSGTATPEPPEAPEPSGTATLEPPEAPEPSGTATPELPEAPEPAGTATPEPPEAPVPSTTATPASPGPSASAEPPIEPN